MSALGLVPFLAPKANKIWLVRHFYIVKSRMILTESQRERMEHQSFSLIK